MKHLIFFKLWLGLILVLNLNVVSANKDTDLLALNQYIDLKISPDGHYLALTYREEEKRNLAIFDLSQTPMKPVSGVKLGDSLSVGEFYWANNSRIIYSVLITRGWYNSYKTTGEMFAINVDGNNHNIVFGQRAAKNDGVGMTTGTRIRKAKSIRATFELIDVLKDDREHVLINATPFESNDIRPTVNKLNIYDGKMKEISKLPIVNAHAIADSKGQLKYSYGLDKMGHAKLHQLINDEWQLIQEYDGSEGGSYPLSITDTTLYTVDDSGHDLEGLYEISLKDGTRKLMYRDDQVQIDQVYLNPNTKQPYMLRTNPAKFIYEYFTEPGKLAKTHQQLSQVFKGNNVSFISFTEDMNQFIFRVSSDKISGDYYMFDVTKQNATFLVSENPNVNLAGLASVKPIAFKNRAGKTIHGYFTKAPNLSSDEVGPMVVMPHGGPRLRDYWYYDPQVQFLASRGLSVLQVNFLGSSGYGKKHKFSGNRQWGDLIQNDITDGTKWAIENNLAEADNVCIYGFSFGGYSSIMSAILEPNLYQCAAAGAGVFDLEMMYKADDFQDLLWGKEYLKSAIGENEQELARFSPVNHTDKLNIPVFLAHGQDDTRVPVIQTKKLVKALKKSGVKHEVVYYSKEGHGFVGLDNRVKFNNDLVKFLKDHLKE